jgi:hypothetical protein
MKIIQVGNIGDTRLVLNANCDKLPRVGIIIEATPDEIKALPFNPAYAEVVIQKKG